MRRNLTGEIVSSELTQTVAPASRCGLPRVQAPRYCCPDLIGIEHYERWISGDVIAEIQQLARQLRGIRVCHINSTASGGGVAEMLGSLVPLCSTLGIQADWRLITGDEEFFRVTKTFHNALQSAELDLSEQALAGRHRFRFRRNDGYDAGIPGF